MSDDQDFNYHDEDDDEHHHHHEGKDDDHEGGDDEHCDDMAPLHHGLCSRCHQNPASVQLTIVNDHGKMAERWLCAQCASELPHIAQGEISADELHELLAKLLAPEALEEIAEHVLEHHHANDPNSPDSKTPAVVCGGCGYSFSRYRKTGMLGCEHCYAAFEKLMIDDLPISKDCPVQHTGHTPADGPAVSQRALATARLRVLSKRLQRAIDKEDFLLAARLRDQIKGIEL